MWYLVHIILTTLSDSCLLMVGSSLGLVIRDRGAWMLSARAERQLQHLPAAAATAAVVARPSRRRVLKALQALPLQALHLAYEAGPSATYGVPA